MAARDERHGDPAQDDEEPRRRFGLVHAGTLEARAPDWLIVDYLEADTLALAFGDPGTGKTFAAMDTACCIATGTEFHGHAVRQGPVVYINGEGHGGFARRLRAWEIRHQLDLADAPLYVSQGAAAIPDPHSASEVAESVQGVAALHAPPALVIVDTVARNFGSHNENATEDMNAFITNIDAIRQLYSSTVLLIHHTGHADKTRARGAMALKGALDAEYRIERGEDGIVRLEATKMKEAEHPKPLAFRIAAVELGITDALGREITSAVLDHTDWSPPQRTKPKARGRNQEKALVVLETLFRQGRENLEAAGRDPEQVRVELKDWREACVEDGMSRQRFHDARHALNEKGAVRIEPPFVLLVDVP